MNDTELKPCPFCGNKKVMVYESRNMHGQASDWVAACMSDKWNGACGASISYLKRARVIEVWNQRADEDNPAAQALDDLWKAIILKNKPDYGDWEYPGQAYRHLLAEYEELKAADPWQRIDPADAGTLPPERRNILISINFSNNNGQQITEGFYHQKKWYADKWVGYHVTNYVLLADRYFAVPYSWMDWPQPAPLPEAIL